MLHGIPSVHLVIGGGTPSWPKPPLPQQYAAPLGVSAQVCWSPAAIETNVRAATETVALPTLPSDVAVTVAEPTPDPVTSPAAETAATVGSVLAHVTDRPESSLPA